MEDSMPKAASLLPRGFLPGVDLWGKVPLHPPSRALSLFLSLRCPPPHPMISELVSSSSDAKNRACC